MSVGDLHDVGRTGEFAVTRIRRRPKQVTIDPTAGVAITVLTEDPALADAIHDAAAASHPVATARTLDETVELAASGRCSILLTDQISNAQALRLMTQRLRKAQPALVVIAVGCASDQNGLISLLSAGLVDRLMLKPVTAALAQIVLKSAVQQHRTLQGAGGAVMEPQSAHKEPATVLVELKRNSAANDLTEVKLDLQPSPAEVVVPASTAAPAAPSRRTDIPRPPWFAVVAALLAVAGLVYWVAADREPAIDPQAVIASNLAAAQRALDEGNALEPRGRSALDHYTTVLALDQTNVAAQQGIDQIADRFAAQAGVAIDRGQVAAAIIALDSVRRVRPEHRQLRELQQRLDAAQATYAAKAPGPMAVTPAPTPKATPASAAASAQQKLDARARAVAEAAEALKRDQQKLASAQQQFALKMEAEQAQLAAARKESAEESVEPPAPAAAPAVAAPEPASPRLVRIVKPEYPQDALIKGAEGWVNVSMLVTPAGNVQDPRVEETSNGTLFNRAAISAVRKWKYQPFVAVEPQEKRRVTVRVDFRMEGR
jgi:protein TonB